MALDERPPVVVVDSGSTDGSAEPVRLVDSPYVAFSDDSW